MSAQDQAEEGGQQKGEKDRFQCTVSESDEERPGGVPRRGMRGAGEAAELRDLEGDGGGVGMRVKEHSMVCLSLITPSLGLSAGFGHSLRVFFLAQHPSREHSDLSLKATDLLGQQRR